MANRGRWEAVERSMSVVGSRLRMIELIFDLRICKSLESWKPQQSPIEMLPKLRSEENSET